MRLLLDECLPRGLKRLLLGHDVTTVPEMGWAGVKDSQLVRLAAPEFDALITIDGGFIDVARQGLTDLGLVVLSARSNTLADLEPLVPELLAALADIRPGDVVHVPSSN